MINMRNNCPAFEIDCVVNFWDLAHYAECDNYEEYFYKLWPEEDFGEVMPGQYALIDAYEKVVSGPEAWEDVKFYIEDCGYRFYDKVMIIF